MRYFTLLLLVAALASSSACVTQSASEGTRTPSPRLTSDCPELEGYPDCQDGQHVHLALASQDAASGTAR